MSSYFSQLLASSGVRIADQPAPAPIDPAMPPAAPDIVELSQETYVQSAPRRVAPPSLLAPNERLEQIIIEQPAPAPQPPTTEETAHVEAVAAIEVGSPAIREEDGDGHRHPSHKSPLRSLHRRRRDLRPAPRKSSAQS